MAFENIAESPLLQKLQAIGAKSQSNKVIGALSAGMGSNMAIILAGSVFCIVATLLNVAGVLQATDAVYQWLYAPYNMTIGLMSVITAFSVGRAYSKALGMRGEVQVGIVTMVLFLMIAAPIQTYTLQDGSTAQALSTSYLGGTGLFTALIMPIFAVRIIKLCQDNHIELRMPDSVPQYLQDSFSAAIPLVINIVVWTGLDAITQQFMHATLPGAIMGILAAPLAGLNSLPGMFIIALLGMLFWVLGIHGTGVISIAILPIFMQYYASNAEVVANGGIPTIWPVALYFMAQSGGGSGNMFPLAILCMRAKSEQLKAIGKVGVIPAFFNVSEPMIFGVPIMYNFLLAIPFILNTLITMAIIQVLGTMGILHGNYIMIMTSMPMFLGSYLTSMWLPNLLIPLICAVVGFICYAPFVKAYDDQLCKQEAERLREEEAAEATA